MERGATTRFDVGHASLLGLDEELLNRLEFVEEVWPQGEHGIELC